MRKAPYVPKIVSGRGFSIPLWHLSRAGLRLQDPHPKLLVMGAALMCSGAMGLPVSGFPNMTAIALEDAFGRTYVTTLDFLMVGSFALSQS